SRVRLPRRHALSPAGTADYGARPVRLTTNERIEMTTATDAGPTRLPVPEEFAFEWEDPADAARLWEREVMHVPTQPTVLDFDLQRILVDDGFNFGCAHYEM